MKRLVAVMMMLGVACGTLTTIGIPQAAAQTATCEKSEKAKAAITAAESMQAIDDAMVAAGFYSIGAEMIQLFVGSLDLEKVKERALEALEGNVSQVCKEAVTPL